jgi:CPA2 family monovalent cation:H+ antiporter-2
VNIVAIQRGSELVVAPKPAERLFPNDEILVLGAEEHVEIIRPFLEGPALSTLNLVSISGYELKHLRFNSCPKFPAGTSIRSSGIREKYDAMVVGIEMQGERVMNPDSDFILEDGFVLWLVGVPEALARLESDLEDKSV